MAIEEEIIETDHFMMLDEINTVLENEIVSGNANVQIVYPTKKNSALDINAIKSRFKSILKFEEKRKHLFTITINEDAGYKTQQFM